MSGFFGIFRPQGGPVDLEAFEQMKTAMHRDGFDGMETHVEEKIAMGHLMLRVSPESKYDKQPLQSSCGNYILVGHFRLDYRDELGDKLGLTQSELELTPDSQLAMLAYQKWNDKCVHHLEGDWAFILFNHEENNLLLFKDKTGTSSCFYARIGDVLLYSSDPIAFRSILSEVFQLNLKQLYIFSFPALNPTLGETLDSRFNYLVANSTLKISSNLEERLFSRDIYKPRPKINYKYDIDYIYDFRSLLSSALLSRLKIDSKVALFLSGGIDSTTIGSFMAQILQFGLNSLTAFTSYPAYLDDIEAKKRPFADERENVRSFVDFYKNTNAIFLDFKDLEISELFKTELTESIFNPIVSKNTFWIDGILKECRSREIKRVFNAQLGNYTITWDAPHIHLGLILDGEFKLALEDLKSVKKSKNISLSKAIFSNVVIPFFQIAKFRIKSLIKLRLNWRANNNYLSEDFQYLVGRNRDSNLFFKTKKIFYHPFSMRKSFMSRLITSSGVKWYLNSCRYGLEVCDPSSDSRVVDYSFSIPEIMFRKSGIKKYLVKSLMKNSLPEEILFCPSTFQQSQDIYSRLSKDRGILKLVDNSPEITAIKVDFIGSEALFRDLSIMKNIKDVEKTFDIRMLLNNLSLFCFLHQKSTNFIE